MLTIKVEAMPLIVLIFACLLLQANTVSALTFPISPKTATDESIMMFLTSRDQLKVLGIQKFKLDSLKAGRNRVITLQQEWKSAINKNTWAEQMKNALDPLLNRIDILTSLSTQTKDMVMNKIWKKLMDTTDALTFINDLALGNSVHLKEFGIDSPVSIHERDLVSEYDSALQEVAVLYAVIGNEYLNADISINGMEIKSGVIQRVILQGCLSDFNKKRIWYNKRWNELASITDLFKELTQSSDSLKYYNAMRPPIQLLFRVYKQQAQLKNLVQLNFGVEKPSNAFNSMFCWFVGPSRQSPRCELEQAAFDSLRRVGKLSEKQEKSVFMMLSKIVFMGIWKDKASLYTKYSGSFKRPSMERTSSVDSLNIQVPPNLGTDAFYEEVERLLGYLENSQKKIESLMNSESVRACTSANNFGDPETKVAMERLVQAMQKYLDIFREYSKQNKESYFEKDLNVMFEKISSDPAAVIVLNRVGYKLESAMSQPEDSLSKVESPLREHQFPAERICHITPLASLSSSLSLVLLSDSDVLPEQSQLEIRQSARILYLHWFEQIYVDIVKQAFIKLVPLNEGEATRRVSLKGLKHFAAALRNIKIETK